MSFRGQWSTFFTFFILNLCLTPLLHAHGIPHFDLEKAVTSSEEHQYISQIRQLTFSGLRAGEGYFNPSGTKMIFQSERDKSNPFYQIYLMDLASGRTRKVSPGLGMTTCSWIHPSQDKVLFSSTHHDPDAQKKMDDEFARRASGAPRPYSWDFDDQYDIFTADFSGQNIINITNSPGYDAEASWSPDGRSIVFASNRHAYTEVLSDEEAAAFAKDPSSMMEIYIMDADGQNIRRLTHSFGYDGGPFFSADGHKITWRKFSKDGRSAEIYTMNADGSEQKQITHLGHMSWAPFFHPSGDYLIFGTNVHGHHNFELYIVDSLGEKEPVRISYTDGFDGLPVFLPNGRELAWTTTRGTGAGGQIFIGKWNDAAARKALDLPTAEPEVVFLDAEISETDLERHVEYLASPNLEGRLTGQTGERIASQYAANLFSSFGLKPAGNQGYFQEFPFTAGVSLGSKNRLTDTLNTQRALTLDDTWRPLSFSKSGTFNVKDLVFAGYGIVAPGEGEFKAYNSYENLDVLGKWVVMFRYIPENVDKDYRRYLGRYSELRRKAMVARDLGAEGIIILSGPTSQVNDELIPLAFDASLQGSGIFALSLKDQAFTDLLAAPNFDLASYQKDLDDGKILSHSWQLDWQGEVEIVNDRLQGRNTLARLQAHKQPSDRVIVLGAHLDHLGTKINPETNELEVFYGADDNASGVAAVLEVAQKFATLHSEGALNLENDIIFALWSGEELGLLGSDYFMKDFEKNHGRPYPAISAYINLDMVGRYQGRLTLQGVGSSSWWNAAIEKLNMKHRSAITIQEDPYLPTDSTSFYLRGVPVLSLFTGAHDDYHKPVDTADKINYQGLQMIADFTFDLTEKLAQKTDAPEYIKVAQANTSTRGYRVYLGTLPDYSGAANIEGVLMNGAKPGSPAEQAGLQKNDILVRLDGTKITNIYDYTYVLSAIRVGESIEMEVLRNGQVIKLQITPVSRS